MLLMNWLRELYRSRVRVHSTSARRSIKSTYDLSPAVLVLESRVLLSSNSVANSYVVTNTADSGAGSLRWAVGQANADHGADAITFDPTVFATPQTITLSTGQIDLNDAGGVSITGPSAGVTISGNDASRVFEVDIGSTANLTGLTITHGSYVTGRGGGVDSQGAATLTNCIVSGNTAMVGGGVCAWQFGSITLTNSTISNNSAANAGGGVYAFSQQKVVLTNCTVSGNSANVGGGIYDEGSSTVTMSGTTVSNNSVSGFGAAICGSGSLAITNSTISGNTAVHGSVGGIFVRGNLSSATNVSMTNVTVSNNSALYDGGLALSYGTETLTNVTISGNTASGQEGGLYSGSGNSLTLNNTIVAGNTVANAPRDISGVTSVSGSNNLIGTGGSGGLVNGTNGNIVGVVNPLLAPLGNYGGSTWTMGLLPGSPAIDAGSKALSLTSTDQRGKPFVGNVDIGAFESQGFTLSAVAGSTPQTAVTGYAFTNPLSVAVTANNVVEPVNGGVINFTVPLSGPSATLSSASANINSGQASVIVTANMVLGGYNAAASTPEAATVTFNLSNVAPLPLGGLGGTSTFIQGGGPVQVVPALVVNPNLSLNIASATVVFTNLQDGDRLDFNNPYALQHSLTLSPDGKTATLTLTGVGSAANYQATLRSIVVWSVAAIPSTSPRTATFMVTDARTNTVTGVQTIGVTLVNQAPVLSGAELTTFVYRVNNDPTYQPQEITSRLSVFDADSNNLTSAKIQIASGYQNDSNSHDVLSFMPQSGITSSFDPATGTLTLTGLSSLSNYRAALRSVLFGSTGPVVNGTPRTISFTVYDDTSPTPLASNTAIINATILLPPALSGLNGTTIFNKGSSPVPIVSTFGINQPLGLYVGSATVTFTNLQPGDRFDFYNQFALQRSLVYNPDETSATLTFSGNATPAQYQTTLQSIVFWNVAGKIMTTPRTATFVITNAIGQSSTPGVQNFTVAPSIKPPLLYGIEETPLACEANHPEFPPQPVTSTLIATHPVSNNLTSATVQITSGYQNNSGGNDVLSFVNQLGISGAFNPATGTMTLSGLSSLTNYRVALQSVTFSTSGSNVAAGTRTLTFTGFDDSTPTPLASNQVTRNVAVTTTNASPGLSGTTTAYYLAIGSPQPQLIAYDLHVTDADSSILFGTTISFTNWHDGDRLDFYNQFALQHTFTEDLVAHTASLTITGPTSVANYQTMLQSIGFYLVAANPSYTPRGFNITVNDGFSNSSVFAGTITVYTHIV